MWERVREWGVREIGSGVLEGEGREGERVGCEREGESMGCENERESGVGERESGGREWGV